MNLTFSLAGESYYSLPIFMYIFLYIHIIKLHVIISQKQYKTCYIFIFHRLWILSEDSATNKIMRQNYSQKYTLYSVLIKKENVLKVLTKIF